MSITSIIAEYNPFHFGHKFHIERTKTLSGGAPVVAVMSPNFVQRGDFALVPKAVRTAAALQGGCDLVLELPTPYALSSAGNFAAAAVGLINSLSVCTHLSFGSECADISLLQEVARALETPECKERFRVHIDAGRSFADAQGRALGDISPDFSAVYGAPNNLLGIAYLRAIQQQGAALTPMTIAREGAQHHDMLAAGTFASASALREKALAGEDISAYLPGYTLPFIADASRCDLAIVSYLKRLSKDDFAKLPDCAEGFSNRLFKAVQNEYTFKAICSKAKTKRYAHARIRRSLLCLYLGIDGNMASLPVPYVRVLGFNAAGQQILRQIKAHCPLPILTKPAHAKKLTGCARELFDAEVLATTLYQLACPSPENMRSEWQYTPVVMP